MSWPAARGTKSPPPVPRLRIGLGSIDRHSDQSLPLADTREPRIPMPAPLRIWFATFKRRAVRLSFLSCFSPPPFSLLRSARGRPSPAASREHRCQRCRSGRTPRANHQSLPQRAPPRRYAGGRNSGSGSQPRRQYRGRGDRRSWRVVLGRWPIFPHLTSVLGSVARSPDLERSRQGAGAHRTGEQPCRRDTHVNGCGGDWNSTLHHLRPALADLGTDGPGPGRSVLARIPTGVRAHSNARAGAFSPRERANSDAGSRSARRSDLVRRTNEAGRRGSFPLPDEGVSSHLAVVAYF